MKISYLLSFGCLLAWSTLPSLAQPIINEILAANAGRNIENDYYNFPDWVEIFNPGTESLDLGSYYISDDIDEPGKWRLPGYQLPAKGYYLVYCDKKASGRHSNFGLSSEGEEVFLSDGSGNIIDQLSFGPQYPNISFGRDPSNPDRLLYCISPTPAYENKTVEARVQGDAAEFSIPAGRLNGSTSLELDGQGLRYTKNGSDPGLNSGIYNAPITVDKTMVLKAKTFVEGMLPGKTTASSYFVNEHEFTLPVVSLSFDPDYFYDDMIGIHVRGKNGSTGNCGSVANWNANWERPAFFEYFDAEGKKQISQSVGVKIAGGCTRGRDQKSISIYARDKYGDDDFDYPFFSEKPDILSFSSLLLRNSGNDQDQTLLRDAYLQTLVKTSMDIDYQSYQPAIVYFNGEYRGIMNLREKTDEDYFQGNYFIPSNKIDFLEKDREVIRGSASDYTLLVDFLNLNNLSDDVNYQHVASMIDIQEYINWMTIQLYIGNRDWPGNNLKFWKTRENGKWRWLLFDLDYGFGFRMDENGYTHETFEFATATGGPEHPNPDWSTLLFRSLLENQGFKRQFLSTYLTHVYSSFDPEWCNILLDSLSSNINFEISYNQQKFGRSKSQWLTYLEQLTGYAEDRFGFMPGYVEDYFELKSDKVSLTIASAHPGKGKVKVNEAIIQHYPLELNTYSELPLSLVALPEKGYAFSHWKNINNGETYSESIQIQLQSTPALALEAIYTALSVEEQLYLNEVAGLNSGFLDEFGESSGFVEIYNPTARDISLSSWFISDDPDRLTRYTIPDSTIIPASGFLLLYADGEARQNILHTSFRLNPDGEKLYLSQKLGGEMLVRDSLSYEYLREQSSLGRYEDGVGNWHTMARKTPGMPNDPFALNKQADIPLSRDLFTLYPNPAAGQLFIEAMEGASGDAEYYLEINDLSGRGVIPRTWLNGKPARLNTSGLEEGMYIVRIFRENLAIQTSRLIISR